ncbi:DUF4168 domain-containing protein [Aurantiacibacter rhizosphaerae]|uniref:DUF4168 domain-containing protein n=1 Tax=Aurantiacibacter rhizosphaerae TaxID=2691582 RepID=A0A844XA98_9SPHN|nr:DUF4168 domain-containing protein [Aurantiacibacter rhizosphaerae]MWV26723.1 DUF4168 domain-containing protein [Aurantiacibacter rhizosphaerae]
MKTLKTITAGALLLTAVGVSAQDAASELDPAHMDAETTQPEAGQPEAGQPEAAMPADAAQPAAPAPAAQDNFSDEQITAFVEAAMEIRGMGKDESVDDAARQAKAEAILTEHGIDPATYNAIGVAAQTDPAVAERIQLAIAEVSENGDS